jgi:uncharacterized protein (TIGR02001 family)
MASKTGIVLLTLLVCGSATAVDAAAGGLLGVTSDYVLRGVSQSDGDPAVQGEVHYAFARGWSTGLWASQVRLLPGHVTAELDAYLQWSAALSDNFDFGATVTHYSYPGDPRPISYDYDELGLSLSWRDQLYIAASWTPRLNLYSYTDGLARDHGVFNYEASLHRSLRSHFDLSAGAGYYDPPGLEYAAYGYGNARLAWHYGHWRADLAWIWAQNADHRQYTHGPAGGPLAASIAWSF